MIFLGFCAGLSMLLLACAYTIWLGPATPGWVFWDVLLGAPLMAVCYAFMVRRDG